MMNVSVFVSAYCICVCVYVSMVFVPAFVCASCVCICVYVSIMNVSVFVCACCMCLHLCFNRIYVSFCNIADGPVICFYVEIKTIGFLAALAPVYNQHSFFN